MGHTHPEVHCLRPELRGPEAWGLGTLALTPFQAFLRLCQPGEVSGRQAVGSSELTGLWVPTPSPPPLPCHYPCGHRWVPGLAGWATGQEAGPGLAHSDSNTRGMCCYPELLATRRALLGKSLSRLLERRGRCHGWGGRRPPAQTSAPGCPSLGRRACTVCVCVTRVWCECVHMRVLYVCCVVPRLQLSFSRVHLV